MASGFDPYQSWLGIPPREQPPHHYRLLGLALFETDARTIEQAAAERLNHLRGFQAGEHAEAAQRLMAEMNSALACLLNKADKAAYDRQLAEALQGKAARRRRGETAEMETTSPYVEPRPPAPSVVSAASASGIGKTSGQAGAATSSLGQLGEYQLLEKLGQGGMGTVYKALHTKLGRVVALKILSKDRVWDERAVARFEREMKAVGAVDHPNIVRAMDAREIGETRILVMEFVDGVDLAEVVRRCHPIPVADACELVRQAALALEGAHAHGLVHRDVKPSNLMLTRQGQVKLLDLGLARFELDQTGGEEVTSAGQAIGTVEYMAPEQLSDSTSVDIRADIYSLGCTLYKFLAGRTPFGGEEYKGTLERLMAHVRKPVPPIWQFRGDVPPGVVHVLERMLAKEPAQRFGTPAELVQALTPLAVGHDLHALLARAEGKSVLPAAAAAPPPVQAPLSTQEASSTLTRFIQQVAEERQTPPAGIVREPRSPWPRRIMIFASLAIVFLLGAIAWVLGHRALHPPVAPATLVFDWPAEERQGVVLRIDDREVPLPATGPLEYSCPPGRHTIHATRPEFKPWHAAVTLSAGQRKAIPADWLPQTYLIFHWPAEERRGATLEVNGAAVDLAALSDRNNPAALRMPVDAGPVWVRITRPGFPPFEERFAVVEGEDRLVRPFWDEASAAAKRPAEKPAARRPAKVASLPPAPPDHTPKASPPSKAPRPHQAAIASAALDKVLDEYQQQSARLAEVLAPIERLAAAWNFRAAEAELATIRPEGPEHAARLAVRREELKRLLTLKERIMARINGADPPVKKADLMLRGPSGEVTKADEEGLEATLPTGKTEFHRWSELSEKSRSKLLQMIVDRQSGDDWVAAGVLASQCGDLVLAEKCFEQARALGGDVQPYQQAPAAKALGEAIGLLGKGQFNEAEQVLDTLAEKYAKLPWLADHQRVFDAARARAKAGRRQAEAKKLYDQAVQLFEAKELHDLRPLVEKLAAEYAQAGVTVDTEGQPSLAEMQQAVAPLGKVLSVRSGGLGQFSTIQEAIDAADSRSLIEIQDNGPFNEKLHVPETKKGLVIRGKKGCWPVITSLGRVKDFPVLAAIDGPGTVLQRLILVHATPLGQTPHCLAIQCPQVRLRTVLMCMEVGEQALFTSAASETRFEHCVILGSGTLGGSDALHNCLLLGKMFRLETPCELRSCTVLATVSLGSPPSVLVDSILSQVRNDQLHRIDHCDVFGMAVPAGGRNCFSADPLFRDPKNLDFRLGPGSPCLKKASDEGDLGCRFSEEMLEVCGQALELRKKGMITF